MADRSILYRLRAALQGAFVSVASEVELLQPYVGVLSGTNNVEKGLQLLDGTGVGAPIFRFQGNYAAQASNISEWFGGRQLTRLRCTDDGGSRPVIFTLPGSTALGTAFDQLVTAGLPETIRFVIEYTGPGVTFLSIVPRSGGPVISGTSSIPVRPGVAATLEITRTSSVISDYVFEAIGVVGGTGGEAFDSLKLINPATAVWDASDTTSLPSVGVVKGNAYPIVNVPNPDANGNSVVLDEVMRNGDRAVWEGESFTSWSAEPHQWFVLPGHEVRRISALESEFLSRTVETPESDRNTIIRGANYADTAGEIRLKIYATPGDYSAADLNTTGDVDEYTDVADQTGRLAIRLTGNQAALLITLPTLYIFGENSSGVFTRYFNMESDFTFQGDFGAESDYLSNTNIAYQANDTLRIYIGTVEERYSNPDLDITEENLDPSLQAKVNNRAPGDQTVDQRLDAIESKLSALFPLTPDVNKLVEWSDVFDPEQTVESIIITDGYSLIADYRGASDRYESAGVTYGTGTNVVTYTGLTADLHRAFGFEVSGPADQTLLWIVEGAEKIPFIDITAAGNLRINNYTPATTENQTVTNQPTFLTRTSGDAILSVGGTTVSTFTATPFPANATGRSRSMQIDVDIYLNGSDTQASGFLDFNLPADNTAQPRQTLTRSVFLGPLYQSRTVQVTIGYELRVSGSDLLIDFTLVSADHDITVSLRDVANFRTYTAPAVVARVDNFATFTDEGGTYTFSGETEFLVSFQPQPNNTMNAVAGGISAAGTVTLLNDIDVIEPTTEFSSIEVPNTIEFRTFLPDHYLIHSEIGHLLSRRATKWAYGLALLSSITDLSVTSQIDFTQGIVLTAPDATRYAVTVNNDGSLKTEVPT